MLYANVYKDASLKHLSSQHCTYWGYLVASTRHVQGRYSWRMWISWDPVESWNDLREIGQGTLRQKNQIGIVSDKGNITVCTSNLQQKF